MKLQLVTELCIIALCIIAIGCMFAMIIFAINFTYKMDLESKTEMWNKMNAGQRAPGETTEELHQTSLECPENHSSDFFPRALPKGARANRLEKTWLSHVMTPDQNALPLLQLEAF